MKESFDSKKIPNLKSILLFSFGFGFALAGGHIIERFVLILKGLNEGSFVLSIAAFGLLFSDYFSYRMIRKIGAKWALVIGSVIYLLFAIVLHVTDNMLFIGITSGLAGFFGISFIWNGELIYIMRLSQKVHNDNKKLKGKYTGIYLSIYSFLTVVGLVLSMVFIDSLYVMVETLCAMGFIFFLFLEKDKTIAEAEQEGKAKELGLKQILLNKKIVQIAIVPIIGALLYGILLTFIPIQIQNIIGKQWVGPLSITPFLLGIPMYWMMDGIIENKKLYIQISFVCAIFGTFLLIFFGQIIFAVICGVIFCGISYFLLSSVMYEVAQMAPQIITTPFGVIITGVGNIGLAAICLTPNFLSQNSTYAVCIIVFVLGYFLLHSVLTTGFEKTLENEFFKKK